MFQTRNDEGEILEFPTLESAFNHAKEDITVWKISFTISFTGERVRFIKQNVPSLELKNINEIKPIRNIWIYESLIMYEMQLGR